MPEPVEGAPLARRRRLIVRDASACPDCGLARSEHIWAAMDSSDYDSWRCPNGHVWATAWSVIR